MRHATTILHLPHRTDRIPFVAALMAEFPGAAILAGVVHSWEARRDTRAIKGAMGSHLAALHQHSLRSSAPLLVLEDDARIESLGLAAFRAIEALPPDCAALLVGADTPQRALAVDGFARVRAPYHGVHGILYNVAALCRVGFVSEALLTAWHHPVSDQHAGLEWLILTVAERLGLALYRLPTMAFTTHPSISERLGTPMPARLDSTAS